MNRDDLMNIISLNYPTAKEEVEDILELLGAIVQYSLQNGTSVQLPGIGVLSTDESGTVSIEVDPTLDSIIKSPDATVSLDKVNKLSNKQLLEESIEVYVHKVNVCN